MRNLANLFFGEGLRNTLDRIVTETRPSPAPGSGNSSLAPVQKPALADDEIAFNLAIAQDLVVSNLRQYLRACGLRPAPPAALEFQSRFLEAKLSSLGMVGLPAVEVQAVLRTLHEAGDPLLKPLPRLNSLNDSLDNVEQYHPLGFAISLRGEKILICRLAAWREHLAHMAAAVKSHIGLLITIRFQLALRDRSGTARTNLLDLLTFIERDFTELVAVRMSIEANTSSGNFMESVEKAYLQFRVWFERVLKPGDDSRRYLPPEVAPMRGTNPPALAVAAPVAEPDAPAAPTVQVEPTSTPETTVSTELEDDDTAMPKHETIELADGLLPGPVPAAAAESATVLQPSNPPAVEPPPGFRSASARVAPDATLGKSYKIKAGAIVESKASIGDDVTIGAEAFIGTGATVEQGAKIGAKVKLPAFLRVAANVEITSIDLRANVKLAQGTVLRGNVLCHANVALREACQLGAGMEFASGIKVLDAVKFSDGAKVDAWKVPKDTRGLKAGGSLYVRGDAKLGANVTVGANVVIDEDAVIEAGANIGSHVKIGCGVTVGAGARIADELEIIADVPSGTVVGPDGTAPDGQRYAHMISTFIISKSGAVKMTPKTGRMTTGSILPALAASNSSASAVADLADAPAADMETEALVLRSSDLSRRGFGSVVPAGPQQPGPGSVTRATTLPSDSRHASPAKASQRLAAAAEKTAHDKQPMRLPGRRINDPRPEERRPGINVWNLPSVGVNNATGTNTANALKRPASEPEFGEQPEQKRHKPDEHNRPPAAEQTSPVSPDKAPIQALAQEKLRPSRLDQLTACMDLKGTTPPMPERATVSLPQRAAPPSFVPAQRTAPPSFVPAQRTASPSFVPGPAARRPSVSPLPPVLPKQ